MQLKVLILFLIFRGCTFSSEMQNQKLIAELEKSLRYDLIHAWYTISVDTVYGRFLSDFAYDWQPKSPQIKFFVTQA